MLCLGRKRNQSVILTVRGVAIRVTVIEIGREKTKLGFEADPEVIIHREEVVEAIRRGERRAAPNLSTPVDDRGDCSTNDGGKDGV